MVSQAGASEMEGTLSTAYPHLPVAPRGPPVLPGRAEAQDPRDLSSRVTHWGRLSTEQEEHW